MVEHFSHVIGSGPANAGEGSTHLPRIGLGHARHGDDRRLAHVAHVVNQSLGNGGDDPDRPDSAEAVDKGLAQQGFILETQQAFLVYSAADLPQGLENGEAEPEVVRLHGVEQRRHRLGGSQLSQVLGGGRTNVFVRVVQGLDQCRDAGRIADLPEDVEDELAHVVIRRADLREQVGHGLTTEPDEDLHRRVAQAGVLLRMEQLDDLAGTPGIFGVPQEEIGRFLADPPRFVPEGIIYPFAGKLRRAFGKPAQPLQTALLVRGAQQVRDFL